MRRYSFSDTIVIINGVEITGWADGDDVIQIKRRADAATDKVGAGGSMMVSISADKSGEATFKLQQTSPSNKYLTALAEAQQSSGELFVPTELLFQDSYRNDMAFGTHGYIKKQSDISRGTAAGTQEWTIVVERLDLLLGDTL